VLRAHASVVMMWWRRTQAVKSMAAVGAADRSLSFGVVQHRERDQALQRADQALYEAKRQGRSRLVAAGGSGEQPGFIESRPLGLTHA
jgi:predicted signal transduction protein with EAL and GGDEF domain